LYLYVPVLKGEARTCIAHTVLQIRNRQGDVLTGREERKESRKNKDIKTRKCKRRGMYSQAMRRGKRERRTRT
jgi:hypothetical protein